MDLLKNQNSANGLDDEYIFKQSKSSTSCRVEDIQGIVFGGIQSRFWMYRKYFNSMSYGEVLNVPFHCWECLTLNLGHRDVDLVIPNETLMNKFLFFLIFNLRTVDGQRGSANSLLEAMNEAKIAKYKRDNQRQVISNTVQTQIEAENEHTLFRKVYLKYLIMRVRSKISYTALVKRKTILELFIQAITRTQR